MIVDFMEGASVNEDGERVMLNKDDPDSEHRPTTNFLKGYVVDSIELQPNGKKKVTWKSTKGDLPSGSVRHTATVFLPTCQVQHLESSPTSRPSCAAKCGTAAKCLNFTA